MYGEQLAFTKNHFPALQGIMGSYPEHQSSWVVLWVVIASQLLLATHVFRTKEYRFVFAVCAFVFSNEWLPLYEIRDHKVQRTDVPSSCYPGLVGLNRRSSAGHALAREPGVGQRQMQTRNTSASFWEFVAPTCA